MPMPPMIDLKRIALTGAMALAALLPYAASAALGEPEATIETDATQLEGSMKTTERENYRMHEIQLPSGALLREFAAAGGNVFAVAWSGPALPNLRQALGRYFDAYVTAAKTKHAGHTYLAVEQNDLVIQSGGHMRAFAGRAYLPQAVPAGTSLEELR